MNPEQLKQCIKEFRECFLESTLGGKEPLKPSSNNKKGGKSINKSSVKQLISVGKKTDPFIESLKLYTPRSTEEISNEKYKFLEFSDDCGELLSGQKILVDVASNYLVGVCPKDSKKWLIFAKGMEQNKRGEIDKSMGWKGKDKEKEKDREYIQSIGVEYPDVIKNCDHYSVDDALRQLFKPDNYKNSTKKRANIESGLHNFLLMILEPARCGAIEDRLLDVWKNESVVPLESLLELGRGWKRGAGPQGSEGRSKATKALEALENASKGTDKKEEVEKNMESSEAKLEFCTSQ
jgi:hypothetical protein